MGSNSGRDSRRYRVLSPRRHQSGPLLQGVITNSLISVNGSAPAPTPAFFLDITPGWLETMRIPILQGRDFRPEDTSPGEAIVSETFARTFFPGQDPIGKDLQEGLSIKDPFIGSLP